jgi:hypothetical protein
MGKAFSQTLPVFGVVAFYPFKSNVADLKIIYVITSQHVMSFAISKEDPDLRI